MNVLLIYPRYPDTFFSFKHSLHFVGRKAALPPLGLITISAQLPVSWDKRLVDLNISPLVSDDLQWADYVFISAMYIQKDSVCEIIKECKKQRVRIVAGGPLFLHESDHFPDVDHFILNESEITLASFLDDLQEGKVPQKIYRTDRFADLSASPVPDFHLLEMKAYASMNIQFSRGCPHACDFCEITALLGSKVRIKHADQITGELDALYVSGWRGSVSIVDDSFIGNKQKVKTQLLPALISWMKRHHYPFIFNIQTPIDLADDKELVLMLPEAGINAVFIGIETPSEEALQSSGKFQNRNRDMLGDVVSLQKSGLQVWGGFIVGFDTDSTAVFQHQIDFIQKSGIVWAMVGLLNAPRNTRLYRRLESENRISGTVTGNNTDYSMNFIPKMNAGKLLEGYQSIIHNIYAVRPYHERIRTFLKIYKRPGRRTLRLDRYYLLGFFRSIFFLGIISKDRGEYWKILAWTLVHRPGLFLYSVMFTITGNHFRKMYGL